jgi:hypothetical protein
MLSTMQGRPLLPKFPSGSSSAPARARVLEKQNGLLGLLEATLEGKWWNLGGAKADEVPYLCYLRRGYGGAAFGAVEMSTL